MSVNEIITTGSITFLTNGDLGASFLSPPMSVAKYHLYVVGVYFTYVLLEDSAGTATLETSLDGINFEKMASSDISYTAASTYRQLEMTIVAHNYFRISFTNASGAGGLVTLKLSAKS